MQNYLVRVYRAHPDDEGSVSGVIEDIESGIQESFHDINELQSLLTRSIMKGQLEFLVDNFLNGLGVIFGSAVSLDLCFEFLVHGNDLVFSGFQNAIEATQNREWNHYSSVLRRTVRSSQKISNIPDNIAFVFECVQVVNFCHVILSFVAN